ncbi:YbaB/EbfC family nucleoid-associated protein [Nocardia arizonensis]|uniref:YbaB/EbfC family nucleoid-associated protein n=1 Tax=Nocardia arizonensis TaxID=1141647 RepID=UPI0006D1E259|nr:YbaB/EbfC family nucleoid-associated protein [Nocardia arizonensis]
MTEDDAALAARMARINEAIAGVRGRARAADGSVYVETDARGSITDLRLSDYALEHDPRRLAGLIADSHRAAHADAEAEAERVHAELSAARTPTAPVTSVDDELAAFTPAYRRRRDRRDDGDEYVL